MSDNTAWNSYIDKFGAEPTTSQLQQYSKKTADFTALSFKDAKTICNANKGKGKIGGAGGGGAAASKPAAGGGGNPLFASLQKGTNITSGLKKVTSDMKNKNKKISGKVSATKKKKAVVTNAKPASKKKKGPRLWIENYTDGTHDLTSDCDQKTEIYFYNCSNSGFQIPAKVKSVIADNCSKLQAEISEVLATVEMINCKSCTFYLKKKIPTIVIDKCSAPKIVLFKEVIALKPEIITSMTSDMNIQMQPTDANADWKEVPIPYQYRTTINPDNLEVETVAVSHNG